MYQKALNYSYEFSPEKAFLKLLFLSNYATKIAENKIPQVKINEALELVCSNCTIDNLDDNYLKPDMLLSICNNTCIPISIFNDDYYSFIFSNYPTKILTWRQRINASQKKASRILRISPVDICKWERKLSYPSRSQFKKLQEVFK